MNFLRANNCWLRHGVISQIKEKHKDLYDPMHKAIGKQLLNYISESKQWWFVFVSVAFLFLISPFINIGFLNFLKINSQTAITIVDQRTANIATIISITLVVVGFILNNLAIKSPLVYRLLFKKSLLYPIIYLTLSTIACFIAASTLRDTISGYQFSRVVLAGTYLAFLILFLIGFLFRVVFLFSNEKNIAKMIDEELMREAVENTKQILLRKYSGEHFIALMNEKGAKEYDWTEAWAGSTPSVEIAGGTREEILLKQPKEKIIYDINLNRISKFISTKKDVEKIYYRRLNLEMSTQESNDFIWGKGKLNTKWQKIKLRNSIVLKQKPKKEKDTDEMRKYFDQKLEELSEHGKYRNLETLLDTLTKLYEFQMKHQK